MKKIRILAITLILVLFSAITVGAELVHVFVNGHTPYFYIDPKIINGRTMVAVRAIFPELGATVDWNAKERTVYAEKDDIKIELTIDSPLMYVNDTVVLLDSPAVIIDNRTYVPLRAVSEAFGATVMWDPLMSEAHIRAPGYNPDEDHKFTNQESVMLVINYHRKNAGLSPLEWDDTLFDVATEQTSYMASRGIVSPENADGEDYFDRLERFGVKYRNADSIVGAGHRTPAKLIEAVMKSSESKAKLLNPDFKKIGVGVTKGGCYLYSWEIAFTD